MTVKIVCTFTESPSFNVRLLHEGLSFFYNSERLPGSERVQKVGKILGIKTLYVGELEIQITQEQYNAICDVEVGMEVNIDDYKERQCGVVCVREVQSSESLEV